MQTVILPGYAKTNREWADLVAVRLDVDGLIRPVFWDHWLDPTQLFYPKEKAMLIYRHAKGDKINIVAHSVGAVVAAYIIEAVPEQINKVIICGIPLTDITAEEKELVKKSLSSLNTDQLICYQKTEDPHGSFDEAKKFLPETVNLVSKNGADHVYPYYDEFKDYLLGGL